MRLVLPACRTHIIVLVSACVRPAGGHVSVLSELLAAGAHHWACQLPGSSLTSSALDLAATGGHLEVRGCGIGLGRPCWREVSCCCSTRELCFGQLSLVCKTLMSAEHTGGLCR